MQAWKDYVRNEASKTWTGEAYSEVDVQLTLVYLFDRDPVDVDNIVKPIQDALIGLVYDDDLLITDLKSHRRSLTGTFDLTKCPIPLIRGIVSGAECVYVQLREPYALEEYL